MESVLGIDSQPRNLRSLYALVLGDDARFCAIAVKTQTS